MPYLGRSPAISNTVTGDLAVSGSILADGQISAGRINHKLALNGSDASSPQANENDQFLIEDGGSDGSGTNAGDNLLLEDVTPSQVEVSLASIAAAGTSGQFLQSQGSLTSPTFATVSQAYSFISKTEITSAVSEVIIDVPESTFNQIVIILHDIHHTSDGDTRIRWSNDGGTTFSNQNYGFFKKGGRNGSTPDTGYAPSSHGVIAPNSWNNAGSAFYGTLDVTLNAGDPDNGTTGAQDEVNYRWTGGFNENAGSRYQSWISGCTHVVAPGYNTAFELSNSGGNLERGVILLYGLAES